MSNANVETIPANLGVRIRWIRGMIGTSIKRTLEHLSSHPRDYQAWGRLEEFARVSSSWTQMKHRAPKLWEQSSRLTVQRVADVVFETEEEVELGIPEEVTA